MRNIRPLILLLLCHACCFCLPAAAQEAGAQEKAKEPQPPPPAISTEPRSIILPRLAPVCFGMPILSKEAFEPVGQEPRLGLKITEYLKIDSAAADDSEFHLIFNDIEFYVRTDKRGLISWVGTFNPGFGTDEGVHVGDSLARVLELSKGKLVREDDCTSYVRLGSGWIAFFNPGPLMPDGTLSPDARIDMLVREDLSERAKRRSEAK